MYIHKGKWPYTNNIFKSTFKKDKMNESIEEIP